MMKQMVTKFSKLFFYLFFASLPFQIDVLLVEADVFYSGFFNPYLSFFLYFGDLLLLMGLLFYGLSSGVEKYNKRVLYLALGIVSAYAFSLAFSVDIVNSLLYLIRILEFTLLVLVLSTGFLNFRNIMYVFIGVMALSSIVGIGQYILQESLGLRFFGEPIISSVDLGIAKVSLYDRNVLRAYSFFPHPNIFAAYLLFGIFFLIDLLRSDRVRRILWLFLLVVFLFALVLTFSRSAFLAGSLGGFLYFLLSKKKVDFKNLKFSVVLLSIIFICLLVFGLSDVLAQRLLNGDSLGASERALFLDVSSDMFFSNPFGVGAGNFTAVMQEYTDFKLFPWQFQPVHNSFLLVLNELGIQGFLFFISLFFFLIYWFWKRRKDSFTILVLTLLVVMFVLGLFDHYFISLYQGQALFFLLLGAASSRLL